MTNEERSLIRLRPVLMIVLALFVFPCVAAEDYERFFGDYVGEAISETEGELGRRDLRVTIASIDDGFSVNWVAVTTKSGGKVKRKEYTVNFQTVGAREYFPFSDAHQCVWSGRTAGPSEG